jgi:hypothetical protein
MLLMIVAWKTWVFQVTLLCGNEGG